MPPAASDDLFRQHSRSPGDIDNIEDLSPPKTDNDSGGKSKKKGKKGAKGKKAAEVTSKAPAEDLLDGSPPSQVEPSSYPDPPPEPPQVNNTIVSPVLDALDNLRDTPEQDFAYRTNNWAKSIPFGKSPPNDGFDDDLVSGSPFGGFLTSQDKGGFSHPSSASPPPRTRPLSYGNGYSSSAISRQQSVDRHKSPVHAPFSDRVPPPHLPQAHFYSAPDIDIPSLSGQKRPTTDAQYSFCAFDTISYPSFKSSRTSGSVLLVGSDGALEVLIIEDRRTRPIGRLEGLNGRVVEAKILPVAGDDPISASRPHVAITIHGPCVPSDEEGHASSNGSEANDTPAPSGRYSSADKRQSKDDGRFYQTRVEIYSLRTGSHITTIFTTKPSPCFENIPGLASFAPSPSGNLRMFASGSYLVLASGISGEVYIYSMSNYNCLGKTWTGIQTREARRYSTSSSSTDPDGSRNDSPHGNSRSDNPIIALKGRWLAIVPPSSTYRASLGGKIPPHLIQGKVFGLETRSPPSRPAVTCVTDVGEGESFLDKVARGVTQEFVRGARWMSDQGLQAWNNYWNKDQQQSSQQRRSQVLDFPHLGYSPFPPTHAQETQTASPAEPDLVSILDLKRLGEGGDSKGAILFNPVATFQVPNGCSFLSFSPSGLMLLTASKKGDVQYVWDLMQAKYCRAGLFLSEDSAAATASVRQVARYPRLTESHIVDVIWCPPSGDRLAIITLKGTVHVFDLPRSAFQWPPFRRARPSRGKQPRSEPPSEELAVRNTNTNALSTAFKLVGGKTQPILEAVRGRAPSAGAAFPAMNGLTIPAAAGMGGKAAAGLSKSMGAAASGTVNSLRHVGENRLHISGFHREPAAARVTWIIHKGQPFLALVANGYFRIHRIKRSVLSNKLRQPQSVIGAKEIDFRLPENLVSPCGPMGISSFNPEMVVYASLPLPLPSPSARPSASSKLKCQPLSQAELETNAPYQPFHTDQRVSLFTYAEAGEADVSTATSPVGQWVFGGNMPMARLHVRRLSAGSEDEDEDSAHELQQGPGGRIENTISMGNSIGNVEEVVITTRRKKKHSSSPLGAGGEDGFFEDDCEVLDFAVDRV